MSFNFEIIKKEKYSRLELLARTFFGWFYIILPHTLAMFVFLIPFAVIRFINFWVIMFTGKNWSTGFRWSLGMLRWDARLSASMFNLVDGYPSIGLSHNNSNIKLDIEEPAEVSRLLTLARFFFGWLYVGIPHGIALLFYGIAVWFVSIAIWVMVLFTGKIPNELFAFQVGYLRWSYRVNAYLSYMHDDYPPFSGK